MIRLTHGTSLRTARACPPPWERTTWRITGGSAGGQAEQVAAK
jgi:hypothetical protein